jgi:tRNA A-37 threonylcarbamoyl transferase component Bud32
MSHEVIEKRARKFTEKIFPTFLTREAAILKILERDLPAPYNRRVPKVISIEKDKRGFVRKLYMRWLQNGGQPLSHMEFARQSADLLRVMHDIAHVIHLDLRLDNMVITEDGVGFVDFGSSVRDDENLAENPLLESLFDELMRTSHIQVMLEKMTTSGAVTSKVISRGLQKVDKAIDFFYLAVQFNAPHQNPDLTDLILYDPKSDDARHLERLTKEILRPADPANPTFRSAKDILHGVERIQLKLDRLGR